MKVQVSTGNARASLKVYARPGDQMGATIEAVTDTYSLVSLDTGERAIMPGDTALPKGTNIRVLVRKDTDDPHAVLRRTRSIVVRRISDLPVPARLVQEGDVIKATVVKPGPKKQYVLALETGETAYLLGLEPLTPGIEIDVKVIAARVDKGVRKVACVIADTAVEEEVAEPTPPSRLVDMSEVVSATILKVKTEENQSAVRLETGEKAVLLGDASLTIGTTVKVKIVNISECVGYRKVACRHPSDVQEAAPEAPERLVTEGETINATVISNHKRDDKCSIRLETGEMAVLLRTTGLAHESTLRVTVIKIRSDYGHRRITCQTPEAAAITLARNSQGGQRLSPREAAEALFKSA